MDDDGKDIKLALAKVDRAIRGRAFALFVSRATVVYGCAGGLIQLLQT